MEHQTSANKRTVSRNISPSIRLSEAPQPRLCLHSLCSLIGVQLTSLCVPQRLRRDTPWNALRRSSPTAVPLKNQPRMTSWSVPPIKQLIGQLMGLFRSPRCRLQKSSHPNSYWPTVRATERSIACELNKGMYECFSLASH